MARPSKFTPETTAKLCQAIELGATYELACKYAGISYQIFNEWMNGRSYPQGTTRTQKLEFVERISDAEGKGAIKWLAKIEKAASDGTWQAAAWKLERRYPKAYGRTVQAHEFSDAEGKPLPLLGIVIGDAKPPEPPEDG